MDHDDWQERAFLTNQYLHKKINRLNNTIHKLEKKIIHMESCLDIEKMKNRICTHIIQKNTNINVDDIIQERADGIHIYEIKKDILPIFVHKNATTEDIPQQRPATTTYRTIKGVELVQEEDARNIQHTTAETIEQENNIVLEANFECVNIEECKAEINGKMDMLRASQKIYTPYITYIKNIRAKMLAWFNIKEYEILLHEHRDTITKILRQTKKHDNKKIKKILQDIAFSPLELRLLRLGKYYNTGLIPEDMDRLRLSLEVCTQFPKEYVVYKDGFKKFHNYNLALFPMKKCIECYMINRYRYNNIVYIPIPTSRDNDPYSFYILDRIDKGKRCWKLDCRLEQLARDMNSVLLPYSINLFKAMYFDMFEDYVYRDDFWEQYIMGEIELLQLLENILILDNIYTCMNILKSTIKTHATIQPTNMDKINIKTDDPKQKDKLWEYQQEYNAVNVLKNIFTGIDEDDANNLINKINL